MEINKKLPGFKEDVTLKDLMQATYNAMSDEFKDRIAGTFESDAELQDFGVALNNYVPGANEFLYTLINQIALIRVNYNSFNSPLAMFRKGMLEFGDTIEDVYVEPVKGMLYDAEVPNTNPGDQFKTFKPEIDVVFYKQNKELVYPITINEKKLKLAFRSYRELDKLVSSIMQQLSNADEIDDFALTMKLLENFGDVNGKNLYYQVPVAEVTDAESAKGLVVAVRSIIPSLAFPSRKYNAKGVLNWVNNPEDMYLLVDPRVQAVLDVEVLAQAFNMSKADFMGHVVRVPGFGDLQNTVALLVHKEFLQIYDTLKEMHTTGLNALHLTTNYFLHHHGIMAVSPFYPAIQFTTVTPDPVSSVEISGRDVVTKGDANLYSYVAEVTGGSTGAVKFEIENAPQYATINQNGNLVVGKNFADNSLTIRAISVEDETKYAEMEITVRAEGDPKSINISGASTITIPSSASTTETYTAVVVGDSTNAVKWSLAEAYTGASINESTGVLTIASTCSAGEVKVKATSTKLTSLKAIKVVTLVASTNRAKKVEKEEE